MEWQVYIILCSDRTLYTGSTNDIVRRYRQHMDGKGAKYFRARKPSDLIYLESGHDRSSAGQREFEIKQLTRKQKFDLIDSRSNEAAQQSC